MTVINLGQVGIPRDQESVTTPQYLLGTSDVVRDAYRREMMMQPKSGIAGIGSIIPNVSNTVAILAIVGAVVGFGLGKERTGRNEQAYLYALIGAITAYIFGKNFLNKT